VDKNPGTYSGLTQVRRGDLNVLVNRMSEMIEMLKGFEWAGNDDPEADTCPICGRGRIAGHELDCRLAYLLTPPKL
jgi:hypothetical protein